MSNINKQAYRADGGDIGTGRLREIADNPYGDEEKCWLAKRVLALLDDLEAKDAQIANLTAERDALREGEMGDARHSNTRAAADIYFQLVEECEIPAGGSLVDYVDDMRDRLSNSEQKIAELVAAGIITKVGE